MILVGTHGWGSMGISDGRSAQDIVDNPITIDDNIMYTFHFYAKSHGPEYFNNVSWAIDRIPVFITEFGAQTYTGDGENDFDMTQKYLDLFYEQKISWTSWNFSDDFRSGAVWNTGICPNGPWTVDELKEAGIWVRDKILNPADEFPGGILSVNNETEETFSLFPNPCSKGQELELVGYHKDVSVNINDAIGKSILKDIEVKDNRFTIPAEFISGTYYVEIVDGEKTITTKIVVK